MPGFKPFLSHTSWVTLGKLLSVLLFFICKLKWCMCALRRVLGICKHKINVSCYSIYRVLGHSPNSWVKISQGAQPRAVYQVPQVTLIYFKVVLSTYFSLLPPHKSYFRHSPPLASSSWNFCTINISTIYLTIYFDPL